jgi:hypothetical protein
MTAQFRTLARLPPPPALLALICLAMCPVRAVADEPSANPTAIAFPEGGTIRMSLNVGAMEVVGVEEQRITVSWRSSRSKDERGVKVKLTRSGANAATLVVDGPGNRVRYRIEVPRQSNVAIRMQAGELDIHGLLGDVDADLMAGELDLRVAEPSRYRTVRASVTFGEITAKPWHFDTGGMWRSFATNGSGEYELRARVLAGQLTLRAE